MTEQHETPIVFLAFANEQDDRVRYLRNLPDEARRARRALEEAEARGLCQLEVRTNATLDDILSVFRRYRNRVAVFHFGGHADNYRLLFEGEASDTAAVDADGFAAFLAEQNSLHLAFLNACSTAGQVAALHAAGVPVIIATSEEIRDEVATRFADEFYKSLASGATLRQAFNEAAAADTAGAGGDARNLVAAGQGEDATDQPPWRLYIQPRAEEFAGWSLQSAVDDPLFGLPAPPKRDLPASPYRRLEWFRREDAEIFFGRGQEIAALYRRVTDPDADPILLFYGQSGVGKSSVLEAGLAPRLEQVHAVTYCRRRRSLGVPATLAEAFGIPDAGGLADAWRNEEARASRPLTVILDQVEEIFTRPNPALPDELGALLIVLVSVFADPGRRPQGKLILSFRKEWLAELEKRLDEHGLPRSKVFVERLRRNGVIEVIEGPVRTPRLRNRYGLTVEPGLSELIADDLLADQESPVAPMLQILLTGMWEAARARNYEHPTFDQALYDAFRSEGLGLDVFLTRQLAALHSTQADAVGSGLALDVLAYHTTPLGTAELRTFADLKQTYYHQAGTIPGLVQACRDLYLLVDPSRNQPGLPPASRLAHDTLAPLVRRRFEESDAPGQRARRIVESRAVDWENSREGAPLDDTDLALVEAGQSGMRGWRPDEARMVQASHAARDRRIAARRRLLVVLTVLAVAATALVGWQWWTAEKNEAEAQHQARLASARQLAAQAIDRAETQPDLSLLLSLEANELAAQLSDRRAQREIEGSLLAGLTTYPHLKALLRGHGGTVRSVAFGTDGLLASGSEDGRILLWSSADGKQAGRLGADPTAALSPVMSVAFSPDGRTLASGAADGAITLWDVARQQQLTRLPLRHSGSVMSLAFSPDGATLASGSADHTVILWDVPSGERRAGPLAGHAAAVTGVAFNPRDGTALASVSQDQTAILWDARDGVQRGAPLHSSNGGDGSPGRPDTELGRLLSVAFSPDGRTLAAGSRDIGASFEREGSRGLIGRGAHIILWDVSTGQQLRPICCHGEGVTGLAFSPDGRTLASSSTDSTVMLWDVESERKERRGLFRRGTTTDVYSVAFSADGTIIATGSRDYNVTLWHANRRVVAHPNGVTSLAFSGDSRFLASGGCIRGDLFRTRCTAAEVRLWDAANPSGGGLLLGDEMVSVQTLAFGPKPVEHVLAAGVCRTYEQRDGQIRCAAGEVLLWDVNRPNEPVRLSTEGMGIVPSLAFSPDGRLLASGTGDGRIIVWDLVSRRPHGELGCAGDDDLRCHRASVRSLAFGGKDLLASGSDDGTIVVWNVDTQRPRGDPLRGPADQVLSLAFNRDGTTLASGNYSRSVILWDAGAQTRIEPELVGHQQAVRTVAFSTARDGAWLLASGGLDGAIILWDVENRLRYGTPLGNAHNSFTNDRTSRVFSLAFSPDGKTLASGSDEGTIFLWDLDPGSRRERACQVANRNLTNDEWTQFMGGRRYTRTCADLPAGEGAPPQAPPSKTR